VTSPSELVRDSFLGAVAEARGLIAAREVGAKWSEPSALSDMDVGSVAGHLARAAFVVIGYLDASDASPGSDGAELLTADQYFERLLSMAEESSVDVHVGVRARAAEEAAVGQAALVARLDTTLQQLSERFAIEPADRVVTVAFGLVLPLDEYLVTRMVELVVHADDLAASAGLHTPEFDALTMACVIGCMLAMVRSRHGDMAVMRSFARRERDVIDAARAF
jgi:hypothetical protein